jgi:hypothetical protein
MKRYDFVKIGSSSFDDIVLHSSDACVGLVVDDNEHILSALPARAGVAKLRRAISLDDVEYIDDFGCRHTSLAALLKECSIEEVSIFKISLGSSSCRLALKLLEYLEKEDVSSEHKPKHVSFDYLTESTPVEDLYETLRKAVVSGYSVESQTPGRMFLNFAGY